MTWIIWFVSGLVIGVAAERWRRPKIAPAEPSSDKVLALFKDRSEITNNDVQWLLGVSDATATRVLDAMEKAGQVTQVGDTGRGVVYKRK